MNLKETKETGEIKFMAVAQLVEGFKILKELGGPQQIYMEVYSVNL